MRHPRRGFTLVEVAVAIAITIILAAVAIPRYNDFIRRQDFLGDAGKIATCIQQAQAAATVVASGSSVRWTAADIVLGGSGNTTLTCSILSFDATANLASFTDSTPSPTSTAPNPTVVENMTLQTYTHTRIYFSAAVRGIPVSFQGRTTSNSLDSIVPGVGNGLRQTNGSPFSLTIQSTSDTSLLTEVVMEQSGAPVYLKTSQSSGAASGASTTNAATSSTNAVGTVGGANTATSSASTSSTSSTSSSSTSTTSGTTTPVTPSNSTSSSTTMGSTISPQVPSTTTSVAPPPAVGI